MPRHIVLLVEAEEPESLSARKMIVENLRHHVITAHSGDEALQLLDRVQPDVVLVHSHIEGQPCKEIIRRIRQSFPHLKIAALSPGAATLCGAVTTINSMRPQDLVSFLESLA